MTHPALALQAAMFSRLDTSSELTVLLGESFVFDDVPKSKSLPYIVFAESIHNDWSTGSEEGMEHFISLNIWSDQNGRKEAMTIAQAVINAFKDLPRLLNDHVLINFAHEFTEISKDQDTELFLAKVSFRAVTEPQE